MVQNHGFEYQRASCEGHMVEDIDFRKFCSVDKVDLVRAFSGADSLNHVVAGCGRGGSKVETDLQCKVERVKGD